MADRASDREPPPERVDVAAPTDDDQPAGESPFPRPILDQVVATDTPFGRPDLSQGYPLEKEERDSLREAIRDIEREPGPPNGSDGTDTAEGPPGDRRANNE